MKDDKVYNTRTGFKAPPDHIPSNEDMDRLANEDEEVVHSIIEGLISFTENIVTTYIIRIAAAKPYREDLTSEALLTLTEFVYAKVGKQIEPLSFISQLSGAIKHKIHDWVRENENTIKVVARQQRRPSFSKLKRHRIKEHHSITGKNDLFNHIWIEEFTNDLNDEQLSVLRLKIRGWSIHKIGLKLNLHRGRILRILGEIEDILGGSE